MDIRVFTLGIIITLSTLISLSLCDDQNILSIELSLPDIMSTVKALGMALKTVEGADSIHLTGGRSIVENLMSKVKWDSIPDLASLLELQRRGNMEPRPRVELAPGTYKYDIVTYPPHFFASRLKSLIKIKARQEERDRDLNAPK